MRQISFILVVLLSITGTSYAQGLNSFEPAFIQRKLGSEMRFGNIYLVRYRCDDRKGYDLRDFLRYLNRHERSGVFSARIRSFTHGVVLSGSAPNTAPKEFTITGVDGPIVPIHVFSYVDGASSNDTAFDRRTACSGQLFVNGADNLVLTAYSLHTTEQSPRILTTALATVGTAVSPLFGLLSGKEIPANAQQRIDDYSGLIETYNSWLDIFDGEGSYVRVLELREGSFTVQTRASNFYIEVESVSGLLTHPNTEFRSSYENLFAEGDSVSAIDIDNLETSCNLLRRQVSQSGIVADEDIAYILYNQAYKAGASRQELVECLTPNYARAAINNLHLYRNVLDSLKINNNDIEAYEEILRERKRIAEEKERYELEKQLQPEVDQEILNRILLFREAARGYISIGELSERDLNRFREVAADFVLLRDDTASFRIVGSDQSDGVVKLAPAELIRKLSSAGYRRFKCHSLTRIHPSLNQKFDGSGVMMLSFGGEDGGPYYRDQAIGLRILLNEEERISQIIATDLFVDQFQNVVSSCPIIERMEDEITDLAAIQR